MANRGQITKIWAGAREAGLEPDDVRDLVQQITGQRSISALTFAQAGQVIDALVRLGARPGAGASPKPSGRRKAPGEVQMITPDQRTMIEQLRRVLGGQWRFEKYFEGACKRLIRKPRPLTAGEAAKVIEMLKRRADYEARRNVPATEGR